MNRTLRRRHRRIVCVLMAVAPALLVAALAARSDPPGSALPEALRPGLPEPGVDLAWSTSDVVGVQGPDSLVVEPSARLVFADMLLLCEAPSPSGDQEGRGLHLLGEAAPGRRTRYPMPAACRGGRIVLHAAADDREIAWAPAEGAPR